MIEVRQTDTFKTWLANLTDRTAQKRIAARIVRLQGGNYGDAKSVGGGVSELRIDYGPGYRLYFTRQGQAVVFLLCGGDKSTQVQDIKTAQAMVADL